MTTEGRGTLAAGRFRLLEVMGDGGMSTLWKARDETTGAIVAVKIVPSTGDDELYKRFMREVRVIRKFAHKNIVTVIDAGVIAEEGLLFLAMELLHGSPLSNHMHGEPHTPEDILPVAIEVCRGIEAAHGAGVIHRDIKPENIFLAIVPGEGVVPKVLDFGLATAGDSLRENRITIDGQVLGTPMYMSPEQARSSAELTPASDLWSIGVILYEGLTGKLPFHGTTVTAVLDAIVAGDPAPIPHSVDPHVRAVVARCLQKDPKRRHRDASELRADLERALGFCLRRKAALANDEAPPSDAVEVRSLSDPERIAAEPPTTRAARLQRQAFRRAGSPILIAVLAIAVCGAAAAAVPRQKSYVPRAKVGLARLARQARQSVTLLKR